MFLGGIIFRIFYNFFSTLLKGLYPLYCYGCRYEIVGKQGLCFECQQLVRPIVSTTCMMSTKKRISVFAAYAYSGPLCDIIRAKKRSDAEASRVLAVMIDEVLSELRFEIDYFVSVPLHPLRQAERGFNQAEIIATELSKYWNIPVVTVILRKRNTPYQASMLAVNRQKNVTGAFEWINEEAKEMLRGKRVCILDDLYTTGATVGAIARLLDEASPIKIMSIVGARVSEN